MLFMIGLSYKYVEVYVYVYGIVKVNLFSNIY